MFKRIFAVAAIIYSSQVQVQAQSASDKQEDSTGISLDEIVVTANKFPQKQLQTGKVLTVIPRSVLEKNESRSLGELLTQQTGIFIAGAGNALGTNQDVYMRGAGSGNTLILVDGIPAYDVSTVSTTFDILHLPVYNIERIEILKGGQSTLYGSDAVAGVINIITRKGDSKPFTLNGMLAAGNYGTFMGSAGLSGKKGASSYLLQYQRMQSDGFSTALDSSGKAGFDNDGYRQDIFTVQYSAGVFKNLDWHLKGQYSTYKTDLDAGAFQDDKDFRAHNRNLMAGTGVIYHLEKGAIQLNYLYNLARRQYVDDSGYVGGFSKFSEQKYDGRSHFLELFTSQHLGKQFDLLLGGDYRLQNTDQNYYALSDFGPYENNLSADSAKVNSYSVYGSVLLKDINGFYLEAGGRLNHHSRYGLNSTFTLNPSYLLDNRWKFFLNFSSAFKAPSLYQLYDAEVGETGLKPEKTLVFETGIQYLRAKGLSGRLIYFKRKTTNGIDFDYAAFRYYNNNRQDDQGLEAEGKFIMGKWRITANYTYVKGNVNTTKYRYDPNSFSYIPDGDTTYNNLFRRPAHSVHLMAGFQAGEKLYLSTTAHLIGKRYDPVFMGTPVLLDSYATFDFYSEFRLLPRMRLFADIRNIFDANYYEIYGFNTRGRNFMAGISCSL